jgi:hypothetical protein
MLLRFIRPNQKHDFAPPAAENRTLFGMWRVGNFVRKPLDLGGAHAPYFRFQFAALLLREIRQSQLFALKNDQTRYQ